MREIQASAVLIPSLVKAALQEGIDPKPIFEQVGVHLDLFHIEQASLSVVKLHRIMLAMTRQSRDKAFALRLGEQFAFEYLPEVETFLTTCGSLRDASKTFGWLPHLINPVLKLSLREEGGTARMLLDLPTADPSFDARMHNEAILACVAKFARLLLGPDHLPYEIRFTHNPPPTLAEYERIFRVPCKFSQPLTEILFPAYFLDMPLARSFPDINRQAELKVTQRLQQVCAAGESERIRQLLREDENLLRGGLQAVARCLHTTPRTLQRRLKSQHQSFNEIWDHARYTYAAARLEDAQWSLEAIGEALGFSDRRSFTRAFKRWSGLSPSEFRRNGAARNLSSNVPSRRSTS